MQHFKYLIIGDGMTADAAIGGIRQADPSGSIGLIGSEPHQPYNRPPLSKALWKGQSVDSIWRRTNHQGVDLHLGRSVNGLDVKQKQVVDDHGVTYAWEKLLLATGGVPRRFSFGDDHIICGGVLLWNTWDQVDAARALIAEPGPFRAEDLRERLPIKQ
jgi:3-phenylpropionate/trans-cinnamate dioxygenase ferredoxin reductase component